MFDASTWGLEISDDLFELGLDVRRQVLGARHVDRSRRSGEVFGADMQRHVTEVAWGEVWARPQLDRRTRRMIMNSILAALGRPEELQLHVHARSTTGVTADALTEVFLRVAACAGIPAANAGVAIARAFEGELSGQGEGAADRS